VAIWDPPLVRLDYRALLRHVLATSAAHGNRDGLLGQNLKEMHAICAGCNFIMTQEANMNYHLGISSAALQNPFGGVIQNQGIRERPADKVGYNLAHAYGNWQIDMTPNVEEHFPTQTPQDSLTPHVAYYLHMCLPQIPPGGIDPFQVPGSGQAARRLYIELSWVILAIACVATLFEEGKRYGDGRQSHGPQQHLGVLDFYISYFIWRLVEFDHTEQVCWPDLYNNFNSGTRELTIQSRFVGLSFTTLSIVALEN
jgi:hypothetical protein